MQGNYLFQVLINLDKPHPTAVSPLTRRAKSLISWETVVILSPSEWGGSNLGPPFYFAGINVYKAMISVSDISL
jgi:hypothetical protein